VTLLTEIGLDLVGSWSSAIQTLPVERYAREKRRIGRLFGIA
jgi:hypothetical protein